MTMAAPPTYQLTFAATDTNGLQIGIPRALAIRLLEAAAEHSPDVSLRVHVTDSDCGYRGRIETAAEDGGIIDFAREHDGVTYRKDHPTMAAAWEELDGYEAPTKPLRERERKWIEAAIKTTAETGYVDSREHREFWGLWHDRKVELQRAGVRVRPYLDRGRHPVPGRWRVTDGGRTDASKNNDSGNRAPKDNG